METIVRPARKLKGTVTVPGELEPSVLNILFAAVAEGTSTIRNTPPTVDPLLLVLRQLGISIDADGRDLTVKGSGLRGFQQPDGTLDLSGIGDEVMPLVAALACQSFATCFALGDWNERWQAFRQAVSTMGCSLDSDEGGVYRIEGGQPLSAAVHETPDLDALVKLSIAVVARSAAGTTTLVETTKGRDWVVRFLRRRFDVERRKRESGEDYVVLIQGEEPIGAADVEIPGDLRLAYPFIAAAVGLRGSNLTVRHVAIRPGRRTFLDTLRQIGAPITIVDDEQGASDIQVQSGGIKSTRIAGKRTEALIEHVALVAVLATQAQGQFVIRDVEQLRQGSFDLVAHLVSVLRAMGAKVGEFGEGIVIDGGFPLQGGRIETHGDPNLALAAVVAGMLADDEVNVVGSECLDQLFPGFFAAVESCKENRK